MKRREFLAHLATGSAGAAAATASLVGCGTTNDAPADAPAVVTRKKVKWRLASSFPRSLDTIYGAAEVMADRVRAMSGGDFDIRVYPAGELVPALKVLDSVQQGTIPIGQSASYYYVGKNPVLAFDTCVPFGLTARQQDAWLRQGGGLDLMRKVFSDFGVLNFPAGNTGAQMGGWFKKEVASAADLQGLRMRIPGLGSEVMSRLGAVVQVLPGGEIYPALERGTIDATEWVGPYDDAKLGFHKVAQYYYYPGWWEPGPSLSYYVGQKAWDELPGEFQEIFTSAATESAVAMQTRYDNQNPAALAQLVAGGTQLRPFSDDIMAAAQQASRAILQDKAAADPAYRAVFEQWDQYRKASNNFFATAEIAYASAVYKRS